MTTAAPVDFLTTATHARSAGRVFLLIGPPGGGKGTQSRRISERWGIPCICTGDILRDACGSRGELGDRLRAVMCSGALVSDDLVNDLVVDRISQPDCAGGFILDGYPRSVPQAKFLGEILRSRGLADPAVLVFDVHPDLLVNRLMSRRYCPVCGRIYNLISAPPAEPEFCDDDGMYLVRRVDDTADVIRERFRAYELVTAPLLRHYGVDGLHRIDAGADCDGVSAQIEAVLAATEL